VLELLNARASQGLGAGHSFGPCQGSEPGSFAGSNLSPDRAPLGRPVDDPPPAGQNATPRAGASADTGRAWCQQPRLLQALLSAGSERRRRELVKAELQALGFDEIGFGCLDISRGSPVVRSFCGHYADAAWVERYFSRRYESVDPRLRAIERGSLPCVWTLTALARQPVAAAQTAELCALVDDLHERGVTGGVMLALPALPGQARRFVTLLGHGHFSGRLSDDALGRVLMLALCLEEFHGALPGALSGHGPQAAAKSLDGFSPHSAYGASGTVDTGDEDRPTGELTPMQSQILDLLSRGMGDKQIAARLDISRHNVDYHLRRLRKRFGVRNRVQLMQAALRAPSPGS
jgi:DNA-binding CsgD family transcriptional regulator